MALSQKAQAIRTEAEAIVAAAVTNDDGVRILAACAERLAEAARSISSAAGAFDLGSTSQALEDLLNNTLDFIGRSADRMLAQGISVPLDAQSRASVRHAVVASIENLDLARASESSVTEILDSFIEGIRAVFKAVKDAAKDIAFPLGTILLIGLAIAVVVKLA